MCIYIHIHIYTHTHVLCGQVSIRCVCVYLLYMSTCYVSVVMYVFYVYVVPCIYKHSTCMYIPTCLVYHYNV